MNSNSLDAESTYQSLLNIKVSQWICEHSTEKSKLQMKTQTDTSMEEGFRYHRHWGPMVKVVAGSSSGGGFSEDMGEGDLAKETICILEKKTWLGIRAHNSYILYILEVQITYSTQLQINTYTPTQSLPKSENTKIGRVVEISQTKKEIRETTLVSTEWSTPPPLIDCIWGFLPCNLREKHYI